MAMDLNDGFDDDDLLLEDSVEEEEDNSVNSAWVQADLDESEEGQDDLNKIDETDENEEVDALTLYLKDNGIEDKNKIKFEGDNGEIEERSWDDLSGLEKLNILRSGSRSAEDDLDDDEIALLNVLRANKLSPQLYQDYIYQLGLKQAELLLKEYYDLQLQQLAEPTFTSDLLTDDELFMLDLQSRVEDITDDELSIALSNAKENPELFEKLMKGIRSEYQRLESELLALSLAILQLQLQEAFEQYSNAVTLSISELQNIGDLDINMDSDDMDLLKEFILGQDESGNNYFLLALRDPETLVQMAWFALHGEEIFNGISNYYNLQITEALKTGYLRGLQAATKKLPLVKKETTVAYKPKLNDQKNNKTYKSLDDLYED